MFLFLLGLWIVFNGQFTVEILLFGIGISAAVCFFSVRFLDYSFRKEFKLLKKLPCFVAFIFMLVREIVKANLVACKLIFKGQKKVKPVVYTFSSPLKTDLAQTLLANAITLTPGTITVSLHDGVYRVHCLDESLCDGIEESCFVKILSKIEAE